MTAFTRDLLRNGRLGWLRGLPLAHVHDELALVHASPAFEAVGAFILTNTGSVSLPYDYGDRRASYLLLDNLQPFCSKAVTSLP